MATMMSIAFSLPTWYLCQLRGSFFIWWLTWLVSLADGIGARPSSSPGQPLPSVEGSMAGTSALVEADGGHCVDASLCCVAVQSVLN